MKKTIASVLAMVLISMAGASQQGWAMMIPAQLSDQADGTASIRGHDATTVQAFLQQKIVRQRLHDFGLTEEEIATRLARLSDQDLHQVALQIENQAPAGDAVGALVTVLVVGILVLLFVYLVKRV